MSPAFIPEECADRSVLLVLYIFLFSSVDDADAGADADYVDAGVVGAVVLTS